MSIELLGLLALGDRPDANDTIGLGVGAAGGAVDTSSSSSRPARRLSRSAPSAVSLLLDFLDFFDLFCEKVVFAKELETVASNVGATANCYIRPYPP